MAVKNLLLNPLPPLTMSEEKLTAEDILGKRPEIIEFFYRQKPELRIIKEKNYAYIWFPDLGFSLYFHGSDVTREIETMSGVTRQQTVIPFDGWEESFGECGDRIIPIPPPPTN